MINYIRSFLGSSVIKNLPANAEAAGAVSFIPESGRPPGRGNGNPLQFSCQDDPMDRGNWQAAVYGAAKSRTLLSD